MALRVRCVNPQSNERRRDCAASEVPHVKWDIQPADIQLLVRLCGYRSSLSDTPIGAYLGAPIDRPSRPSPPPSSADLLLILHNLLVPEDVHAWLVRAQVHDPYCRLVVSRAPSIEEEEEKEQKQWHVELVFTPDDLLLVTKGENRKLKAHPLLVPMMRDAVVNHTQRDLLHPSALHRFWRALWNQPERIAARKEAREALDRLCLEQQQATEARQESDKEKKGNETADSCTRRMLLLQGAAAIEKGM